MQMLCWKKGVREGKKWWSEKSCRGLEKSNGFYERISIYDHEINREVLELDFRSETKNKWSVIKKLRARKRL